MIKVLEKRSYDILRGLVLAGLVALTVIVLHPNLVRAQGGCWDNCVQTFGECKHCEYPWEGYNGELDHCSGTSCYYVCGSACDTGG